jgi:hypothetical protein
MPVERTSSKAGDGHTDTVLKYKLVPKVPALEPLAKIKKLINTVQNEAPPVPSSACAVPWAIHVARGLGVSMATTTASWRCVWREDVDDSRH